MPEEEQLRAIEVKLGALLALELDKKAKEDTRTRTKPRSLDKVLSDAGLEPSEIAPLLGKTPTAVRAALKRNRTTRKKPNRKAASRKRTTRSRR